MINYNEGKETLADALAVHENFVYLLELNTDFLPSSPNPVRGKHFKHSVLHEFYSKTKGGHFPGYDADERPIGSVPH